MGVAKVFMLEIGCDISNQGRFWVQYVIVIKVGIG